MATSHTSTEADRLEPKFASALAAALRGLQFGSIELIVHDSRVVQIERREKVRFAAPDDPQRDRR
jgi:hypothetical protein